MDMPIWTALIIIGFITEFVTPGTFWFTSFGVGATAAAIAAYAGLTTELQMLIFFATTVSCIIALRYWLASCHKNYNNQNNTMIGKQVLVTQDITPLQLGTIELYGVTWSAESHDGHAIQAGRKGIIKAIRGNRVIVKSV